MRQNYILSHFFYGGGFILKLMPNFDIQSAMFDI